MRKREAPSFIHPPNFRRPFPLTTKSDSPESFGSSAADSASILRRFQAGPQALTAQNVIQLQRLIGNKAVTRLLATSDVRTKHTHTAAQAIQRQLEDDAGGDSPAMAHTFANGQALFFKRGQPAAASLRQAGSVQRVFKALTGPDKFNGFPWNRKASTYTQIKQAVQAYNLSADVAKKLGLIATMRALIATWQTKHGTATEVAIIKKRQELEALLGQIPTEEAALKPKPTSEDRKEPIGAPATPTPSALSSSSASAATPTVVPLKTGGEEKTKIAPPKSGAAATYPETHEAAMAYHSQARAQWKSIIARGAEQKEDRRLANTCEWIQSGRTKFYVLTPTDEGYAANPRKIPRKVEKKHILLFPNPETGAGDLNSPIAEYQEPAWDDPSFGMSMNLTIQKPIGAGGERNEHGIYMIIHPRQARALDDTRAWQNLKHEVQHDADKSGDTLKDLKARNEGHAYAFEHYKTEYRAYSGQGSFDEFSNASKDRVTKSIGKVSTTYSWTPRQFEVFKEIYAGGIYPTMTLLWDTDSTFRDKVIAYWNPDTEGFNRDNSVRVDDFYNALHAIPLNTTDQALPAVAALIRAIEKLEIEDANYIQIESPAMLRKIRSHLANPALAHVLELIAARA